MSECARRARSGDAAGNGPGAGVDAMPAQWPERHHDGHVPERPAHVALRHRALFIVRPPLPLGFLDTHSHREILNNTQVHVARAQLLADHVRAVLLRRLSRRAAPLFELQLRHHHPQTHMILIATTPLPSLLPMSGATLSREILNKITARPHQND